MYTETERHFAEKLVSGLSDTELNALWSEVTRTRLERLASNEAAVLEMFSEEERDLVRDNRIIPAIKAYRARMGCGLKAAKDAVDALITHQQMKGCY